MYIIFCNLIKEEKTQNQILSLEFNVSNGSKVNSVNSQQMSTTQNKNYPWTIEIVWVSI